MNANTSDDPHVFAPLVAAAERILSQVSGSQIRLGDVTRLTRQGRRNVILRCHNLSGHWSPSFIIKKVDVATYNPSDTHSWDVRRLISDWAGVQFLSTIPSALPYSPRCYGGDYEGGFVILEDLGPHRSLVDPLLAADAVRAEDALLTFAARLGQLHAATIGQSAVFARCFQAINPHAVPFAHEVEGLATRVSQFQTGLERLAVRPEARLPQDLARLITALAEPGPFRAYIHADPCPDNVFFTEGHVRLIDFEFGRFGHALLDGTYGRMLFPTCWCAHRLPSALVARMEAVYRAALVQGCPAAQEDRVFDTALVRVCGFWLVETVVRHLEEALGADRAWGIATIRSRLLSRLEAFIATADVLHQLEALRGTAHRVLEVLRKRWPDVDPLPLYPAFHQGSLGQPTPP
jgi:hypothetical protein